MAKDYSNRDILRLLQRIDEGYTPTKEESQALRERKELELWGEQISALPESVGQLANLQKLDLGYTRITALPESVGQLANLQTLNLSFSQITALPESIGQLANLQKLNLRDTQIAALPESIGQLVNLQTLSLRGTQITALPDSIGNLTELRSLGLGGTEITALPESVRLLSKLEKLHIWETKITALPEWIGELPALRFLELIGLTLPAIPESLALRGLPFTEEDDPSKPGIVLSGVTLTRQDKSIFLEHPELIPSLYQKEQITLRECRVIFLGDGAAGKSYTIRRFRNEGKPETADDPYVTSETPGVEILDYNVKRGADSFTVHFWDFGGQQLLHSMHRCFLTDETCYVVMVKTRETKANDRARYWLRNVRAFAPNSPILLFVNCWENDDGRRSIDEPGLRGEFPKIQNVIYCSAKQADEAEFRETVMEPIIRMVAESDGIAKQVPRDWDIIRRAIKQEGQEHNYLTRDRYHELCAQNNVENDEAPELLRFFNTLGVCFSYHIDHESRQELADYRLLDPVWLTNGIYAIIKEGSAQAHEGRIRKAAIEQLLCNPPPEQIGGKPHQRIAPEKKYKKTECPYLLAVAEAHELCYQVNADMLFFPALCGTDTPEEALKSPLDFPHRVEYRLHYDYLPDSVVHRLMIRCIRKNLAVIRCWNKGLVLGWNDTHRAILRMEEDDRQFTISILSRAEQPAYDLFRLLREELLEINHALNLKAREFILDGEDAYSLQTLLSAMQRTDEVYGPMTGNVRQASHLLGRFYDDWTIKLMRAKDGVIIVPILPMDYHYYDPHKAELRSALYKAYNGFCAYCWQKIKSEREMEVDHIFPSSYNDREDLRDYVGYLQSRGFDTNTPNYVENYAPVCSICNGDKSNYVDPYALLSRLERAARKTPQVLRLLPNEPGKKPAKKKQTK